MTMSTTERQVTLSMCVVLLLGCAVLSHTTPALAVAGVVWLGVVAAGLSRGK